MHEIPGWNALEGKILWLFGDAIMRSCFFPGGVSCSGEEVYTLRQLRVQNILGDLHKDFPVRFHREGLEDRRIIDTWRWRQYPVKVKVGAGISVAVVTLG